MLLLCKGDSSIQTLSLGVTTPNLIPVPYGYWVGSLNIHIEQPAVLSFRRNIPRGLDQTWSSLGGMITSCNPSLIFFSFVFVCFCCFFLKHKLCKGTLSILILSLGVTIPHITQFCKEVEFSHSIFWLDNTPVLIYKRIIARGLDQMWPHI